MSVMVFRLNELPEYADQFGPDFRARCRSELSQAVQGWAEPYELVGHGDQDSLVVLLPSARKEKAESRAAALAERAHALTRLGRLEEGLAADRRP